MFPAISDFLQTTFTNNLAKFLQPTYIVSASIILLLNLLFIFPELVSHNILLAIGLLNLNIVLQSALLVALVLVLAYLLLSASSTILTLMTGEMWRKSALGRLLSWLHAREWDTLTKKIEANPNDSTALLEKTRYFPEEENFVGPTTLGNVLSATASYVWNHYSMDMVSLWSHMEVAIARANDTELKTRLDNEKTALDFLVTLAFILGLFAVEQVLVQFCWLQHDFTVLWGPLVSLVLAYMVYRAAINKARTWGDAVQMAFDIHRSDLKTMLGLRDFSSQDDAHDTWGKASNVLLLNKPTSRLEDIITTQSTLSIKSSANVKVEAHSLTFRAEQPEKEEFKQDNPPLHGIREAYYSTHYVLLISDITTANNVNASSSSTNDLGEAYTLVADPRVAVIDFAPVPAQRKGIQFAVEVIRTSELNEVDELLWHVEGLKVGSSTALSYTLFHQMFRVTIDDPHLKLEVTRTPLTDRNANTYEFVIKNTGQQDSVDALLEVCDNTIQIASISPGVLHFEDAQGPEIIEAQTFLKQYRYCWKIKKVAPGKSVNLKYTVQLKENEDEP